jgi:hypothetical protein
MSVVAERKLRPTMSVLVSATPMGAASPLVGDAEAPPHLPKFLLRVKTWSSDQAVAALLRRNLIGGTALEQRSYLRHACFSGKGGDFSAVEELSQWLPSSSA